jgi:hypothetical protein
MTGMRNDDLINYLENRNNRFKNSAGMELGNSDGKRLWTFFSLSDHDYGLMPLISARSRTLLKNLLRVSN